MPHAVEMPSFLSDDTGPVLSSNHHNHPFDTPSYFAQSYEKTNGNIRSASHTSMKGNFGDGSNGNIDGGDAGRAVMNGDMLHDGSLNAVPNGRSNEWDTRSSQNGSTSSVNGGGYVPAENGRKSPVSLNGNGVPRTSFGDRKSVASTNGVGSTTIETKPSTMSDNEVLKTVSIPPPVSTNPQSTGPLTYNSSLLPPTPVPDSSSAQATSPHRFSSPPTYTTPSTPLATSPSTGSLQHPGSAQLKHRHTLQVPKLGLGRSSRDGDDAYSSGRFSPTSVAAGVRRGSLSLNRRNTQSIHSTMPYEEVPPDEDAMLWAEAVRQKRASKRRRKDEEDDDRVVVGTKVDQHHVNWVTAYNMLTGIRFTVSRTNAKMDRPLTDADFEARHKFSFDM